MAPTVRKSLITGALIGMCFSTSQARADELYAQSGPWSVYERHAGNCFADLTDMSKPQGYGRTLRLENRDGSLMIGTDFPVPNSDMQVFVDGSSGYPVGYQWQNGIYLSPIGMDLEEAINQGQTINLNLANEGPEYLLEGSSWALRMVYECSDSNRNTAGAGYLEWKDMSGGAIDPRAEPAGFDASGDLFVCLADHNDGRHPGKIGVNYGGCRFGYGGQEWTASSYFLAVGPKKWTPTATGTVPYGALPIGFEANGDSLYSCRTNFNGEWQLGKTRPGFQGCNFSYQGMELTNQPYEVLTE